MVKREQYKTIFEMFLQSSASIFAEGKGTKKPPILQENERRKFSFNLFYISAHFATFVQPHSVNSSNPIGCIKMLQEMKKVMCKKRSNIWQFGQKLCSERKKNAHLLLFFKNICNFERFMYVCAYILSTKDLNRHWQRHTKLPCSEAKGLVTCRNTSRVFTLRYL